MARLPQPGSDKGTWGDVLNDFLSTAHNPDGTIKSMPHTAADIGAEPAGLSSSTLTSLSTKYLQLGANLVTGTRSGPMIEFDNDSNQSSIHLVGAQGFSGPYLFGIGVNGDNITGQVIDVTNPGARGLQANVLDGAGASTAVEVQINQGNTNGIGLSTTSYGATGLAEKIHAAGTPATGQQMILWQTDALAGTGDFGADLLRVYADTGVVDATSPVFRKNGGYLVVQNGDAFNNGQVDMQRQHGDVHELYAWTGTNGLYWGGRIHGTGNFGGVVLDVSTGPSAIGSETWAEAFRVQNVSGAPGVAFFGATPVNKPTGVAVDITAVHAALVSLGLISS